MDLVLRLALHGLTYLGGRTHRYRPLGDDDLVAVHGAADGAGGLEDVLEVGRAVFVRRGAHGDEDDVGGLDGSGDVGRERQAAGAEVAGDQRLESGLVYGDLAGVEAGDLFFDDIRADDVVDGFC